MVTGTEQILLSLGLFGQFSGLVLLTSIIAILGFFISGMFIYFYYRKFYGVTEAPKGWRMFFIGLILMSFYQLMKTPYTYKLVEGDIALLIFLIFQLFVMGVLVYGLYLLKKEVEFT